MAKNRRQGEGSPTLGETVHMWLSSAKILYTLLIALGAASAYGNSEAVRTTVHRIVGAEPVSVAPGEVVAPTEGHFEAQARQSLASIVAKLKEHDARFDNLEAASERDDTGLQSQIDALREWHE